MSNLEFLLILFVNMKLTEEIEGIENSHINFKVLYFYNSLY